MGQADPLLPMTQAAPAKGPAAQTSLAAAASTSSSNHLADHPSLPDSDDLLGMTAHTPGEMFAAALASSTADLAALTSSGRTPAGSSPMRPGRSGPCNACQDQSAAAQHLQRLLESNLGH